MKIKKINRSIAHLASVQNSKQLLRPEGYLYKAVINELVKKYQ